MKKNNLTASLSEGSAPILDAVLSEIPVVSIAVSFLKARDDIRDRMFEAKLQSFIEGLDNQSSEEIKEMLGRVASAAEATEIGTTLMFVLETYNGLYKCELLGKLFRAYLQGAISNETFQRLAMALTPAFPGDLKKFLSNRVTPEYTTDDTYFTYLESSGLTANNGGFDGGMMVVTRLGEDLRRTIGQIDANPSPP